MAAITRLGPGAYPSRLAGTFSGRTATTTLQVCHETRKALESVVSSLATVAVNWPGRPFTVPATTYYRVLPIRWNRNAAYTIGATSRLGRIGGLFVLEVWQPEGAGLGAMHAHADGVRDAFNRLTVTVPSGMECRCAAPGGPVPVTQTGYAGLRLSIPFDVVETITS